MQVWKDDAPLTGGQILLRGVTLDRYDPTNYHWSRSNSLEWDQPAIGEQEDEHDVVYQFSGIPARAGSS